MIPSFLHGMITFLTLYIIHITYPFKPSLLMVMMLMATILLAGFCLRQSLFEPDSAAERGSERPPKGQSELHIAPPQAPGRSYSLPAQFEPLKTTKEQP